MPLMRAKVAGDSMRPALRPNDWLLVYRSRRVRVGDVVVAYRPDRRELQIIKRVTGRDREGWWLEGDNPGASHDSWVFGAVPDSLIVGRVLLRYWPAPALAGAFARRAR